MKEKVHTESPTKTWHLSVFKNLSPTYSIQGCPLWLTNSYHRDLSLYSLDLCFLPQAFLQTSTFWTLLPKCYVCFSWIFPCPHVMYSKLDCPLDQQPRFESKEGNMAATQNHHFLCFDVFGAQYCVKWNAEDFLAMPYHGGHELLVKLSTLLQSHGTLTVEFITFFVTRGA